MEIHSRSTSTAKQKPVPKSVAVKSVTFDGFEDVYDLTVPFLHNFSINGGLIVHNCMDALRYLIKTTANRWRL